MYCKACGARNDDNAYKCVTCGEVLQQVQQSGVPVQQVQQSSVPAQQVPNYLVQAILVTIFCCVPFGIVAIIYAAQVNSKLQAGDYDGAVQASKQASTWSWVSFGVGLAAGILYIILAIVGAAFSRS
ncbi:MAG: CD225/dispanin family protein [Chloroflexi bacterium]|nr:CD225/dispanin family protein [Chloroflexota bacterium]